MLIEEYNSEVTKHAERIKKTIELLEKERDNLGLIQTLIMDIRLSSKALEIASNQYIANKDKGLEVAHVAMG